MKHAPLAALLVLSLSFAACSGSDDPAPAVDGSGGGGGEGTGASGGTGGGPDGCATDGTGSITVEVTGLPDGVDADVIVTTGSAMLPLTETEELADRVTGDYTVTATRVTDDDPIVRTVYDPLVTSGSFCLEDGASQTVTVAYTAIPSSNKLWTSNLRGFASADLEESGDSEPSVVGDGPIGKDVAFDRDGNLWAGGATLAEATIVRIPAANLGSSGDNDFDRELNVPEVECLPALRALAFDADGDLWLAVCGGQVLELEASELARSGDASSATVISELEDPSDLAFDAAGNLWISSAGKILRYDAARLDESTTDPADLVISARDAEDSRDLGPSGLAFDTDGNLWGFDFGSNTVFELGTSDLEGSGEESVVSEVSFVVGVGTLVNRGAFDEGGGLWLSYATDEIARLAPDQLTESAGSGDPVTPDRVIASAELDSDLRVALFPAAEGLPLYHTAFAP